MIDHVELWIVIIGLGIGSFALRFVFVGLVGNRPMPGWLLRHLRYTAVAILPALVTPQVLWPAATGGQTDMPRLFAALMTVALGLATKNVMIAIFGGAASLYAMIYLVG